MMAFLAIAGAIVGFIGAQKQASALKQAEGRQRAAAEESRSIANKNAARIEAETHETLRREKQATEANQALSKARAAAAGGTQYGSTGVYQDTMEESDSAYLNWIAKSGASRADIAKSEGQFSWLTGMASADATHAQVVGAKFDGLQSLIGGASAAYGYSK